MFHLVLLIFQNHPCLHPRIPFSFFDEVSRLTYQSWKISVYRISLHFDPLASHSCDSLSNFFWFLVMAHQVFAADKERTSRWCEAFSELSGTLTLKLKPVSFTKTRQFHSLGSHQITNCIAAMGERGRMLGPRQTLLRAISC